MTDTIKLLVAIGSDASLRYASPDELKCVLEQAQASVELTLAVELGNGAPLRVELCIQQVEQVPQMHAPGQGGEEEEADVPPPEQPKPDRPSPPPTKRGRSRRG
ncbi:hypothetical protein ABQJ54_04795 [Rhodanobacter sp. Si-c]|uniref:Uncharacterized protein n=1 Tax=Rhodanobacter lycopersici TaxID=3162487 RepID=A0ABV3QB44_9GAMM